MVFLLGCFDAAGHPDQSRVLSVGGYVGDVRSWTRFDKKWKEALSRLGLKEFHMADFMADKKWKGRESERDAELLKLVGIIRKNVRVGISTAIHLSDWRAANEIYALKRSKCTPYALCAFLTINKTMRYLRGRKEKFGAHFIFEEGDKHRGDFKSMMDDFRRVDKRLLKGVEPEFREKAYTPLQAADLAMWTKADYERRRPTHPMMPLEPSPVLVELQKIPLRWGVMRPQNIIDFCEDFEVPKVGESREWTGVVRHIHL